MIEFSMTICSKKIFIIFKEFSNKPGEYAPIEYYVPVCCGNYYFRWNGLWIAQAIYLIIYMIALPFMLYVPDIEAYPSITFGIIAVPLLLFNIFDMFTQHIFAYVMGDVIIFF